MAAAKVGDLGRSAAKVAAPTAAWGGSGEGCAGGAVTETAVWACGTILALHKAITKALVYAGMID